MTKECRLLRQVDEPNSAGQFGAIDAPNQATFYTYDLLNNLTQVQQPGDNNEECGASTTTCSQTRSFQYDSLSRLKQATNPESGTIQYGYDPNGNLQTKTDARGIVTTFGYDALNRVKQRSYAAPSPTPDNYSATPTVSYFYDNLTNAKGKLIKVASTVSTTEYVEFDILGRVTRSKQTTDGVVYGDDTNPMTYSYNLSGALIEQKYPSGRVVRNTLDADGDLMAVLGRKSTHPQFWAYANNFKYVTAGAVTSMQLGNGNWESTTFNSRLQPTQIALGTTQNATNLLDLDYEYGTLYPGTGVTDFTKNNGNISKQTITVASVGATPGFVATQYYAYDQLNRIQIVSENITPVGGLEQTSWRQSFSYDRYGNRNFVTTGDTATTTLGSCLTAVCNPSISPSTNKIASTGYSFDAAGNTSRDAQDRKFTYDAENKQTKVETVSGETVTGTIGEYFYDGDGKRIKKRAYADNVLREETIFVYDAGGKLIGEYSNEVASLQNAKIAYLTNDHLGSPRINTDANGAVTSRHDYHPFGEETTTSQRAGEIAYVDDTVRKQFTGYEHDLDTGLDFAQARYYASVQGRFTAPDPLLTSGKPEHPQSWNRYPYCLNSPLIYIDPSGLEWRRNQTGGIKWYNEKDDRTDTTEWTESVYAIGGDQFVTLDMNGPNSNGSTQAERQGWSTFTQASIGAGQPDDTGAFQLLFEFLSGTGPDDRQFGSDAYMTQGMRTSPDVEFHRQKFLDQGGGIYGPAALRFGTEAEDGPFESGFNMPRQFVGSFHMTITEKPQGDALFEIDNTTHLKSLLYNAPGIQPVERSTMAPLSNKTQKYFWVEKGVIPR